MKTPEAMITAKSLEKRVVTHNGSLTILAEVSLSINAGERVAIVGASGSGKTTLLGLLAGLDTPTAGEVVLCGQPLSGLDENARAQLRAGRVGFVFQSFQLLPMLTALENVQLPLEILGDRAAAAVAHKLLERVGLADRKGHYPRQLSGGEQQRVAIARAFAASPQVLFADEPTGNLDAATGETIIGLLLEMNREQNTTLVMVTHDEALASRCDRRIGLQAGHLVAM